MILPRPTPDLDLTLGMSLATLAVDPLALFHVLDNVGRGEAGKSGPASLDIAVVGTLDGYKARVHAANVALAKEWLRPQMWLGSSSKRVVLFLTPLGSDVLQAVTPIPPRRTVLPFPDGGQARAGKRSRR